MKTQVYMYLALFFSSWATAGQIEYIDWELGNKRVKKEVVINKGVGNTEKAKHFVILAPGFADGKWDPFFAILADRLSKKGLSVLRFNWYELSPIKDPKNDYDSSLLRVLPELKEILHEKYGATKVSVLAKSWGSRIYGNVLKYGLMKLASINVLITPNCISHRDFVYKYMSFFKAPSRLHVFISKEDPYCSYEKSIRPISDYSPMKVHLQKGNHGFRIMNNHKESIKNFEKIANQITNLF